MSCGNPHETDCSEVLDHLYEYLDHEMSDGERPKFKEHFGECNPCLEKYGLEQAVKKLVKRCCGTRRRPRRPAGQGADPDRADPLRRGHRRGAGHPVGAAEPPPPPRGPSPRSRRRGAPSTRVPTVLPARAAPPSPVRAEPVGKERGSRGSWLDAPTGQGWQPRRMARRSDERRNPGGNGGRSVGGCRWRGDGLTASARPLPRAPAIRPGSGQHDQQPAAGGNREDLRQSAAPAVRHVAAGDRSCLHADRRRALRGRGRPADPCRRPGALAARSPGTTSPCCTSSATTGSRPGPPGCAPSRCSTGTAALPTGGTSASRPPRCRTGRWPAAPGRRTGCGCRRPSRPRRPATPRSAWRWAARRCGCRPEGEAEVVWGRRLDPPK